MIQYGFFIDLSRCIGCNACTISCKQWKNIAPGPEKPMRVYQWETGRFPNVILHVLPIMCYHCETPVCMEACENRAIFKEEKYGAVLVDRQKCKGSRKCWSACPYGSPQFESDSADVKMQKCDMCIDRLEQGLKPICVLSCGMRALEFGPMDSMIRKYGNINRLEVKPGYAPCRLSCPAGINAETYIHFLTEGRTREAVESLRESTPFSGVLGRICPHPCEGDCQRGMIDKPVSIRLLKRYAADEHLKLAVEKATSIEPTKRQKVAIVGAGPAGLSCAYDLVRKGYPITVYEAFPKPGGMMEYGIPEYRLPKKILQGEIGYIEDSGVKIKTNCSIKDINSLFGQGYEAVFVATGAWKSLKLDIAGEDSEGVNYGLDFLNRVNSGQKVDMGSKVAVIGGGNVAIDAARVAKRLGAREVNLICLESRDLTCRDRMIAQETEIEEAECEGISIHPCLGISKILSKKGRVIALETAVCSSVLDGEGRFAPVLDGGAGPKIETDFVIIAVGQMARVSDFWELERLPSGSIKVDPLTLETSVKGVFAGADVVTGPSNVISAISQGKEAAISIDRHLRGEDLKEDRRIPTANRESRRKLRSTQPPVPLSETSNGFAEVEQGFDEKTTCEESERCLRCGSTMPCMVFKPPALQDQVIPWDFERALELWKKRQPYEGKALPDIFADAEDLMEAPFEIVGRNRLVLKAKNSEELLYYTMDDE